DRAAMGRHLRPAEAAARDRRAPDARVQRGGEAAGGNREDAELRLCRRSFDAGALVRDQPRRPRALAQAHRRGGNGPGLVRALSRNYCWCLAATAAARASACATWRGVSFFLSFAIAAPSPSSRYHM